MKEVSFKIETHIFVPEDIINDDNKLEEYLLSSIRDLGIIEGMIEEAKATRT